VEETVSHMLERQARFVEGVKRGIASADCGDLAEHEEVAAMTGSSSRDPHPHR
jgi:predicted transcriptional regulator